MTLALKPIKLFPPSQNSPTQFLSVVLKNNPTSPLRLLVTQLALQNLIFHNHMGKNFEVPYIEIFCVRKLSCKG